VPQSIKMSYDSKYDMLYVKWDSTKGCYGDDSNPGLIYARDTETGAIKGVTIVHFVKRYQECRLPVLDETVSLDYEQLYKAISQ